MHSSKKILRGRYSNDSHVFYGESPQERQKGDSWGGKPRSGAGRRCFHLLDLLGTAQNLMNSSGVIPACFKMALKVPSGISRMVDQRCSSPGRRVPPDFMAPLGLPVELEPGLSQFGGHVAVTVTAQPPHQGRPTGILVSNPLFCTSFKPAGRRSLC